ncbi:NifU family protein [Saccharopolyspora rhizosphaerae]|uniref:NifU family protein n=1 Tax=Saccharopolyspora rhizosphaerae TaxID=2492662 RepID=A0A426JZN5_9PSEU|nr:NifU family protein [Saccharopolyspora rhizosphaerae]RRO18660.1 NifU family protein [Saccharopolyspora rhizosphaerae]
MSGNEVSGERIDQLLASFDASGPLARQRAEELVRLVSRLHGAGLERVLEITDEAGLLSGDLLERFADDELVSSLLLLHGLHPHDVETRIERALERVRPYLGSHGGDVRLLGVEDSVVRLRMLGTCQGCPSSTVTLTLAVEGAIEAAAPEIESIECDDSPEDASVIPAESLLHRARAGRVAGNAVWEQVEAGPLESGQIRSLVVSDVDVVVCRVGRHSYAFRDACPGCGGSVAGASLQRAPGGPAGSAILICPTCRSHYDVRAAGAGLDEGTRHLDPLPLLENDGVLEIAVPAPAVAG